MQTRIYTRTHAILHRAGPRDVVKTRIRKRGPQRFDVIAWRIDKSLDAAIPAAFRSLASVARRAAAAFVEFGRTSEVEQSCYATLVRSRAAASEVQS